jgi:hypothetical protein
MPHSANRSSMLIACASLVGACSDGPTSNEPARTQIPEKEIAAAEWEGRWQGPEGTYLELDESGGRYRITISNLDGPRTFEASVGDDVVSFMRDGVLETVRAGNGADTGMKWLADKSNCLVVKAGEGYCRG